MTLAAFVVGGADLLGRALGWAFAVTAYWLLTRRAAAAQRSTEWRAV